MELFSFDAGYVQRLANGDAETERHFTRYFDELIFIKLRARQFDRQAIEDIRQETYLRVFQLLRRDSIRQPERIGALVNTVCNNVAMEFRRSGNRLSFVEATPDSADDNADSERELLERERHEDVRRMLKRMSDRNQRLLTAVFLEEREPDDVCREFSIDRNYLRVLLFRARSEFRDLEGGAGRRRSGTR